MQSNWSSKRDWRLFRSKLAGWQEAYIGRLNKEYIELLCGDGSEADKFWELCKLIREDRRCAGVQISMRGSPVNLSYRSQMWCICQNRHTAFD